MIWKCLLLAGAVVSTAAVRLKKDRCPISTALEAQRQSDEFTDVILRTPDGKNFSAHQVVLAAQSPAMAKLLEDAMNAVDPDTEYEVFDPNPESEMLNDESSSSVTRRRRFQSQSSTTSGKPVQCSGMFDNTHYPHPTRCDMYIQCLHGKPLERPCGPGTAFSPASQTCVWPRHAGCDRYEKAELNQIDFDDFDIDLGQQQQERPRLNLGQQQQLPPSVKLGQEQRAAPRLNLGKEQRAAPRLDLGQEQQSPLRLDLGLEQQARLSLDLGQEQQKPIRLEVAQLQQTPQNFQQIITRNDTGQQQQQIPRGDIGQQQQQIPRRDIGQQLQIPRPMVSILPKNNKYCHCNKLIIEVPHKPGTMGSILDFIYTGETEIEDPNDLVSVATDYELDEVIETITEETINEIERTTVKKLIKRLKKIRTDAPTDENKTLVEKIFKKIKKRKDIDILAKDLPAKEFIEYLEEQEMTTEYTTETVLEYLQSSEATDNPITPDELNTLIDELDFEKMNCTELAKVTGYLADSPYDARKVLAKVLDMSQKGVGKCQNACGECMREYVNHMKFHYEPRDWNLTTILKPQSTPGLETTLGTFYIGKDEFTATFQRDVAPPREHSCVDGLVLYRNGPPSPKGFGSEETEFDMELIIDPKGDRLKDCPLRNRIRYKFEEKRNMYKWNTNFDYNKPQDVYIKMNPVAK